MNLIKTINILKKGNYYGCGEYIEIAKGSNHYSLSLKHLLKMIKRKFKK